MSDKTTQEYYPLLEEDIEIKRELSNGHHQLTSPNRKRYLDLTKRYFRGRRAQVREPLSAQVEAEYRGLERKVLAEFLHKDDDYLALRDLIDDKSGNIGAINRKIEIVRNRIAREHVLPESRYSLLDILRTPEELNKSVAQLESMRLMEYRRFSDGTPPEVMPFAYPEQPSIHIEKLYSWVQSRDVDEIMNKGMLPGICAARGELHPYLYATFMANDFWGHQLADERSDARKKKIPFTQLEFTYEPSMEVCMRMPILNKYPDGSTGLGESWVFISSQLTSLDKMVSALAAFDLEMLKTNHDEDVDSEWLYSPLLKEKIPPDALTSPYSYEHNELILTGFVPPTNIRVL